jgi:hypothetical protein
VELRDVWMLIMSYLCSVFKKQGFWDLLIDCGHWTCRSGEQQVGWKWSAVYLGHTLQGYGVQQCPKHDMPK